MYRMLGCSYVMHLHLRCQGGMAMFCGVLFSIYALVSVQCLLWMHDLSRLAGWWVVALCLAFQSPLRNLFLHMEVGKTKIYVISMAECAVWVCICVGLEHIFLVVAQCVLGELEF